MQQQQIPVRLWPLIGIRHRDVLDAEDLVLLKQPEQYEWLIFPSPNAVSHFFQIITQQNFSIQDWLTPKIAAVGRKTAQTLHQFGIQELFVPDIQNATFLTQYIKQQKRHKKILLCVGEQSHLPKEFQKENIPFDKIVCYQTTPTPVEQRALIKIKGNILFFASPSAVESFLITHSFEEVKAVIAIGDTTAQKIIQHFSGPLQIAQEPSEESVLQCILKIIALS